MRQVLLFFLFFDNWYKCLDSVWHNRQLINMCLMIGFNIDKLPSVHILSMYILSIMYQTQYYCCEYNNIPDKHWAILKLIILCSERWIFKKTQVTN